MYNRTHIQENVTTGDMFTQEEKLLAKPLHRKNDPPASKIAARKALKFKPTHAYKIRVMLKNWPDKTARELDILSQGEWFHLTYSQIDRRVSEMDDVLRLDEIRGGYHVLRFKDSNGHTK